ncbi:MarR family transcriptional regulator [Bradyrhizobium barranii subsp. apii]|uniref:MarR family transcriptional regulator n=1 Tax=Bradyrhizobium barranii subsp. apii TaxID=2819348 RepID=A0A8T5UY98_9BRAD|nr:MarR family transcriptional regulator [Bradyrhizobium barranii]UPT86973.1 MarR family transcriptional regulator [Bradyrhizobium barranii subsp. apii]
MVNELHWDFQFGYLIHDVSRLRRIVFDRFLAPLKITRSQWRVLELIARESGVPQTQIANELDMGKVAIGSLVDRLEGTGFVVRKSDPSDRRVNRVCLTQQAQELLGNMRKEIDDFDARIMREVKECELQATSRTLLSIKRALLDLYNGTNG